MTVKQVINTEDFILDYCKYVDVFLGNGQTDRIFTDGIASKWFYIKAQCGNTLPHATLPFGRMSVGAYSGGYPGGYGTHYPNSCGGIKKLSDEMLVYGFSHLHQSGTGDIQFFYNYALTTPYFGDDENSRKPHPINDESARPGYYSVVLDGIKCEFTVDGGIALHKYCFPKDGGKIAVDFSNDGLSELFESKYRAAVKDCTLMLLNDGEVGFSGIFSGIRLYFAVKVKGAVLGSYLCRDSVKVDCKKICEESADKPFQAIFLADGRECELSVAYSTVSLEEAREQINKSESDFLRAAERAYGIWNDHLSRIRIETDSEELREKFYSNLYHSLIKPADMTGESILGVKENVVSDFATFWDQYKTVYPLIYFAYPEMSQRIVRSISNISETLGKIPCSFGLSEIFPSEMQGKMLGVITLTDAYHMGIADATVELIEDCTRRELARDDFKVFIEEGVFERYTHILDATDACLAVREITQDKQLAERLKALGENWRNAYGNDGLMSERSPYYEGDRYTYSFRLQNNMEERIDLLGGKDGLLKRLDSFFGFDGDGIKQMTHLNAYPDISKTAYHRFEGFNNECDMETPYAYVYTDRHDRLEDIIRECVTRCFGLGRGGLPGNNDSGGLSSLLVWNTLGIFPASGNGEFLVGLPMIKSAEIDLSSGNRLRISLTDQGSRYISRVLWNGSDVNNFRLRIQDVMAGGELEIIL